MYQTLYLTSNPTEGIKQVRDALEDSIVTSNANSLFLLGFVYSYQKKSRAITLDTLLTELWTKTGALDESSRQLTKNADDCEGFCSLQHTTYLKELYKLIDELRNSPNYRTYVLLHHITILMF